MKSMKYQKITQIYYIPIQLKLPLNFKKIIKFSDPVYSFNEIINHINLNKYFVNKEHKADRPRYDHEKLFKIILFDFMEYGYPSLCQI